MPSIVEPQSTSPEVRLRAQIKALEDRVAAIERGLPIPIITGAPGAATGQDGSLAGDTGNKLWLRINGVWRYTAVT